MSDRARERDLILAPNEYAFIADETKGNINAYVGPYKTSLANTDQPVVFNAQSKRFEKCGLEAATQSFAVAPVGWYLVLKNPTKDAAHPRTGAINNLVELEVGRKVNLPGPAAFALWPGQMVRVIQGHSLRSNQYLIVRVYDEEAAKANWKNAVIKPQGQADEPVADTPVPDLTMGQQLVIKGTDVSFYIPSTGIEVVADPNGSGFVREAVTLERLEYCILLDEDGNKSYLQGPAVVFPSPTQAFVERGGAKKFRAIELNENSGIYIKVIAPYQDERGSKYDIGAEQFITGKDQMIYFPRQEHAVIKYGDHTIHYAVAIPAGEARYVLDRNTGNIRLQRGPSIYLPDPRREVIVRRILDSRHVALWYPGNAEALAHNQRLAAMQAAGGRDFLEAVPSQAPQAALSKREKASSEYAGDDFNRGQTFTPPRMIVLDTRYDGAVAVSVWTGYAVLVVSKSGERKVIVGPNTYMLEYDEILQTVELSTGTPKTDDRLERTVYLRVLYNKVSDVVEAETADLVSVRIRLSYRVNFEGDPQRWFNVENYVKFLTEHLRSLLRAAIKQRTIQAFHPQVARDVRDVVLGTQGEGGKRPGRLFEENGMRVYDVEVLDVQIGDDKIAGLLIGAQHAVVEQTLTLDGERRRLEQTRERELINQGINTVEASTRVLKLDLQRAELDKVHAYDTAKLDGELDTRKRKLDAERLEQEALDAVHDAKLARSQRSTAFELDTEEKRLAQRLRELEAEVKAVAGKASAISPDLIAALQSFGDQALAEKMAESMAPLAILGGESVVDVLARLLRGTKLANVLQATAADDDED
jgi:major vault protein